jgi:hypothetical protein
MAERVADAMGTVQFVLISTEVHALICGAERAGPPAPATPA